MKKITILLITLLGLMTVASAQSIRPNQILRISITGVPVSEKGRLDNEYSVSASGNITMWQIGTIKASGLTKTQLADAIASRYKAAEIYTSPVFQVYSKSDDGALDNQLVTIGGQVRAPGQRQWTKGMNLYSAIQAAGGETPYGAMNRVKLYRRGEVYQYDMKERRSKAIEIFPNDIIEVPQKNIIGG
ncbi:MAG: polysaccharide biosynthesis/export family protein [Akkermansiaceae bacterium]